MIDDWARTKTWWLYLVPAIIFTFFAYKLYIDREGTVYLVDSANLGIHELGHEMFRPFGEFMTVAGGTILQLLIPFVLGLAALKKGYFYIYLLSLLWLVSNLRGVAIYAGDAIQRQLLLVNIAGETGVGGEIGHDWYFLLGELGLRTQTGVSRTVLLFNGTANVISAFVVMMAFYLVFRIATYKNVPKETIRAPKGVYRNPSAYQPKLTNQIYRSDPIGYKKPDPKR